MDAFYRNITIALRELGQTADEVAASLRAEGCIGIRNDVVLSPVAKYINCAVPQILVPIVSTNHITVITHERTTVEVPLPQAVVEFLAAFNDGAYDDLAVTIADELRLSEDLTGLPDINDLGDIDW